MTNLTNNIKTAFLLITFFLLPILCNAESHEYKDEILIISSYNSDTKYNYETIKEFIELYKELGGTQTIVVENMNQTILTEQITWIELVDKFANKHQRAN